MVGFQGQPHPVPQAEGADVLARQLEPARSRTEYSCATSASRPSSSVSVRRSTSVLIRPSLIAMVRRTCSDTMSSCVTISTVTPSSAFAVRRAAKTPSAVSLSSSPVGSSASST